MMKIDDIRFASARARVLSERTEEGGVGTLSEKLTHKILKYYFEPCEEYHEVSVSGSIADIKNKEGIIEIQTGSFERLVPKLEKLLPDNRITVVHPIVHERKLVWVDRESGEMTKASKSRKKGSYSHVLPELYKICAYIPHPNLTVKLVLVNVEEFKALDGYGKDRKIRAGKIDRIPTKIVEIIDLKDKSDYAPLLPATLPHHFTAKEFNTVISRRKMGAFYALKFLLALGIIERDGNRGRAFLYKRKESQDEN